jgi:hypothetical protein
VGSRCSSDRARALRLALALALATGSSACVTVRPEQRELLADSAMTFGAGGDAEAHEEHVLSNREGSTGATATTGGGCGCN